MDRFDPRQQDIFALHSFCTVEDGVRWFDHGTLCERPHFHTEETS